MYIDNFNKNTAKVNPYPNPLMPPPRLQPSENSPTLQIKVSSTRLIPGLHEQLTLVLQTTSEGPFKFSFTIIGELQTYKLTVTGHVLPPDGFHALAALAKLEGRSGLGETQRGAN